MENISSYLNKFKTVGVKEMEAKEKIIHLMEKSFKINLSKKDVIFKNGIATLKVAPIIKNEILVKKTKLLVFLNKEGISIKDIR